MEDAGLPWEERPGVVRRSSTRAAKSNCDGQGEASRASVAGARRRGYRGCRGSRDAATAVSALRAWPAPVPARCQGRLRIEPSQTRTRLTSASQAFRCGCSSCRHPCMIRSPRRCQRPGASSSQRRSDRCPRRRLRSVRQDDEVTTRAACKHPAPVAPCRSLGCSREAPEWCVMQSCCFGSSGASHILKHGKHPHPPSTARNNPSYCSAHARFEILSAPNLNSLLNSPPR